MANDSDIILRIKQILEGQDVPDKIAKGIDKIKDKQAELAAAEKQAQELRAAGDEKSIKAAERVEKQIVQLKGQVESLGERTEAAAERAAKARKKEQDDLARSSSIIGQLKSKVDQLSDAISKEQDPKALRKLKTELRSTEDELKKARGAIIDGSQATDRFFDAAENLSGALGPLGGLLDSLLGPLKEFAETGDFTKLAVQGTIALGTAVTGLIAASKELVEARAAANKEEQQFSEESGLSRKSIAALGIAARASGRELRDLAQDFPDYQQNISKARQGTEETVKAFEKFKVTSEDLKKSTPDELLRKLATNFNQVGDATERATALAQIFGDGGAQSAAKVLPKLQAAFEQLEKTGNFFNPQTAQALENYTAAVNEFESALSGLTNILAGELAPAFTENTRAATDFIAAIQKNKDLVAVFKPTLDTLNELATTVLPAVIRSLSDVDGVVNTLAKQLGPAGFLFDLKQSLDGIVLLLQGPAFSALQILLPLLKEFGGLPTAINDATAIAAANAKIAAAQAKQLSDATAVTTAELDKQIKTVDELAKAEKLAADGAKASAEVRKQAIRAAQIEGTKTAQEAADEIAAIEDESANNQIASARKVLDAAIEVERAVLENAKSTDDQRQKVSEQRAQKQIDLDNAVAAAGKLNNDQKVAGEKRAADEIKDITTKAKAELKALEDKAAAEQLLKYAQIESAARRAGKTEQQVIAEVRQAKLADLQATLASKQQELSGLEQQVGKLAEVENLRAEIIKLQIQEGQLQDSITKAVDATAQAINDRYDKEAAERKKAIGGTEEQNNLLREQAAAANQVGVEIAQIGNVAAETVGVFQTLGKELEFTFDPARLDLAAEKLEFFKARQQEILEEIRGGKLGTILDFAAQAFEAAAFELEQKLNEALQRQQIAAAEQARAIQLAAAQATNVEILNATEDLLESQQELQEDHQERISDLREAETEQINQLKLDLEGAERAHNEKLSQIEGDRIRRDEQARQAEFDRQVEQAARLASTIAANKEKDKKDAIKSQFDSDREQARLRKELAEQEAIDLSKLDDQARASVKQRIDELRALLKQSEAKESGEAKAREKNAKTKADAQAKFQEEFNAATTQEEREAAEARLEARLSAADETLANELELQKNLLEAQRNGNAEEARLAQEQFDKLERLNKESLARQEREAAEAAARKLAIKQREKEEQDAIEAQKIKDENDRYADEIKRLNDQGGKRLKAIQDQRREENKAYRESASELQERLAELLQKSSEQLGLAAGDATKYFSEVLAKAGLTGDALQAVLDKFTAINKAVSDTASQAGQSAQNAPTPTVGGGGTGNQPAGPGGPGGSGNPPADGGGGFGTSGGLGIGDGFRLANPNIDPTTRDPISGTQPSGSKPPNTTTPKPAGGQVISERKDAIKVLRVAKQAPQPSAAGSKGEATTGDFSGSPVSNDPTSIPAPTGSAGTPEGFRKQMEALHDTYHRELIKRQKGGGGEGIRNKAGQALTKAVGDFLSGQKLKDIKPEQARVGGVRLTDTLLLEFNQSEYLQIVDRFIRFVAELVADQKRREGSGANQSPSPGPSPSSSPDPSTSPARPPVGGDEGGTSPATPPATQGGSGGSGGNTGVVPPGATGSTSPAGTAQPTTPSGAGAGGVTIPITLNLSVLANGFNPQLVTQAANQVFTAKTPEFQAIATTAARELYAKLVDEQTGRLN